MPPDTSTNFFDGLGRVYNSQHVTPQSIVNVDTVLDAFSHATSVSNPYYTKTEPTYGLTQPFYDALGRVYQTTEQDGSATSTDYSAGNCTLSTDEAGHQRKSCTDALGRLVEVDEPDAGVTGGAAHGSITISGSLRSPVTVGAQAPVPASASVSLSGVEKFITVTTHQATSGIGSVSISGTERAVVSDPCSDEGLINPCPQTIYDSGSVSVTVNGHTETVSYGHSAFGGSSTATTIASALANAFHNDAGSPVDASAAGAVVTLTAHGTGAVTNYSASTSSSTDDLTDFPGPSFTASSSGATLLGGTDAVTAPRYDSGNISITVNGHADSISYGQTDTPSTLASRLANQINGDASAFVTASSSGTSITLFSKVLGTSGDYAASCSTTYDTADFCCSASFAISCVGSDGAESTGRVGQRLMTSAPLR